MASLSDIALGNFTKIKITPAGGSEFELADVQSIGDVGDEATIVDVPEFNRKYLRKLVGSANAGPMEVVCNLVPDLGQTESSFEQMEDAYTNGTRCAVVVELLEDDAGTNGDKFSFNALVASKTLSTGFDTVRTVTWSLAIDGAVSAMTAI